MKFSWNSIADNSVKLLWKYADGMPKRFYLAIVRALSITKHKLTNSDYIQCVDLQSRFLADNEWPFYRVTMHSGSVWNTSSYQRVIRYIFGIDWILLKLYESYGMETLLMGEVPEIVIDCGANVGEFSILCERRFGASVYAFEPDPISSYCHRLNTRGMKHVLFELALSDKTGSSIFYSAPDGADSSLYPPENTYLEILIQTQRFDEMPNLFSQQGSRLLKMDAEGFEPEVLAGFGDTLQLFKWVTVDVSAERGGDGTGPEVISILEKYGFDKIYYYSENIVHAKRN
jgi:FkbM family methyltransferase